MDEEKTTSKPTEQTNQGEKMDVEFEAKQN
jgi:hypothetical protein